MPNEKSVDFELCRLTCVHNKIDCKGCEFFKDCKKEISLAKLSLLELISHSGICSDCEDTLRKLFQKEGK